MLIEVLEVACPAELREAFIERDAQTWTAALARQPGFIGKEVWASLDDPGQLILVIRWETLAHWKTFPVDLGRELDRAMGDLLLPLTCRTYESQRLTPAEETA